MGLENRLPAFVPLWRSTGVGGTVPGAVLQYTELGAAASGLGLLRLPEPEPERSRLRCSPASGLLGLSTPVARCWSNGLGTGLPTPEAR